MRFCAIVAAGGSGERFGQPKQLIDVTGRPMVAWSFAAFEELAELDHMVIATEPAHLERMESLARAFASHLRTRVVASGPTRQGSVRNALAAVPDACDGVFVHDGARPLVRARDIRAGMAVVGPGVGAVLATPLADTIKVVPRGTRTVSRTLDRDELWAAQTPQFASTADLRAAHAAAERDGIEATDDVSLLERIGIAVVVVPATSENFKVTTPEDRKRAEVLLSSRVREGAALESR